MWLNDISIYKKIKGALIMRVSCTGRKVNLKEDFEERVETRLAKLDKFFGEDAEAQVTVTVEKSYQKVEITVREGGFVARAERTAPQMEEAFDSAADVLTQNIIKNRKKMNAKATKPLLEEYEIIEENEPEVFDYEPIREKHFSVKPCLVEEAIEQMNLLEHSFYLFRDAETDEINAVYRRKDGKYGLLVPER